MTRGKGSPCGGKKRQRHRFLVTLTVASDAGMDERQRGEVGCLRRAWKGRKGGEKGAAASGWLSPFILVWRGGGGNGWRRAVWGRRHASGVWGVARRGGRAAAGADDHTE
jgi:hypothetical protein